jgi:hypothetical protein
MVIVLSGRKAVGTASLTPMPGDDLFQLKTRVYLVTLTHSPAWEKKFGTRIETLMQIAADEFRETARKINQRATQIGTEADYDETWGPGR